jgi:hypothetical protein
MPPLKFKREEDMIDMPDLPTCVPNRTPYTGMIQGTEESQGDVFVTLAPSDIDIYCSSCHLVFHTTIHVLNTNCTGHNVTQAVSLRSVTA